MPIQKKLSEQEKIAEAHKAIDNYIATMQQLTQEQRAIFIRGLDRLKQKEIEKLHQDINQL